MPPEHESRHSCRHISVIDAHTVMNAEQPAMARQYYGKHIQMDAGILAIPTGAPLTYIH